MNKNRGIVVPGLAFCGLIVAGLALAQQPTGPMSFFVTSAGSGNGGDLGGLGGAAAICQRKPPDHRGAPGAPISAPRATTR